LCIIVTLALISNERKVFNLVILKVFIVRVLPFGCPKGYHFASLNTTRNTNKRVCDMPLYKH